MLRVSGESMIDAGIMDGDYIIVRQQETAINGDIVVALIDDEATVKRFYRTGSNVELRPENSTMRPIVVTELAILGVVTGLIRRF
jgi:repressor LexA